MRKTHALPAAISLAISLLLSALVPATAVDVEPQASTYSTGDYISITGFSADYAKRMVTLRYKVKKALPLAKSRIELVVRNVHASAPQLLQVSDANIKVGSSFNLTYAVSAAVPIDMLEASATLLTPLPNGMLQRNDKLAVYALYGPTARASGRLVLNSTHISKKLFNIPTGSQFELEANIPNSRQLSVKAVVAAQANDGLAEDNISTSVTHTCTLAAGNYVETSAGFVRRAGSDTGVNIAIDVKFWTNSKRTKKACADLSTSLNYLS